MHDAPEIASRRELVADILVEGIRRVLADRAVRAGLDMRKVDAEASMQPRGQR